MKKSANFYITTTLPYVNAEAHLGHAMEFIRADIIARSHALRGEQVFFNNGADEHGVKIQRKAAEEGRETQAYVDEYAAKLRELLPMLGIVDAPGIERHFIRTSSPEHRAAAQKFWQICAARVIDGQPVIYKKNYQVKYCVNCELEKTDSELNEDGRCLIHPNQDIELISEENYFFRFSAFAGKLAELYASRPDFVVPDFRFNEIKAFVSRGLEDFSISRLKSKMSWGIEVPGDPDHVMYVWFDALVSYISTLGWPDNVENFKKWWLDTGGVVQYCGKDNLRQQSAMWQAMLMAAELPPSRQIIVDGFITGEGGVKMSKSLGNVVNPVDIIREYGTDALRYYIARETSPFEDSPFTIERFKETFNAGLANGIGNLTSRILKLTSTYSITAEAELRDKEKVWADSTSGAKEIFESLDRYNIQTAINEVWKRIEAADHKIQETTPFKLLKSEDENTRKQGADIMKGLIGDLQTIAILLEPFMPETSAKILSCVSANSMPEQPLFLRK